MSHGHQHPVDLVHHHRVDEVDPACAMAHGDLPAPTEGRRLVVVFDTPVARSLAHFAGHVGFQVLLLDPVARAPGAGGADGLRTVRTAASAGIEECTDVVVTDHDRPELGMVLAEVLAAPARWVGVVGSRRHTAPHLLALAELGVPAGSIARVHRPIGLDIGARSPAEIAVATLAGLLADRNGRAGGPFPAT